ncbi:NACHT domain-containing protein [Streptomyces sp. NPDC060194]|uniref:NACHT domain-containing protein n=1 Tax=Streptomyces sp. NPDC060194 TaxID=3347069 RepID=UPI0036510B92
MEPVLIGTRLASSAVAPLVKRLFVTEGPGADLVDAPVRLSGYVSFTGEKRTLSERDLRKLAGVLVHRAQQCDERPAPADEEQAVVDAVTRTLHALGDLDLTDVEAVQLGHEALAARLSAASGRPERHLSADAAYFHERLVTTACLHVLNFFTQRSAFIAATLVAQSRAQAALIARVDELIARTPLPGSRDVVFEARYREYIVHKHGRITIYGIDLHHSPDRWPLDAAYLSLEATGEHREDTAVGPAGDTAEPPPVAGGYQMPAENALTDHDRVLLRGVAGSGKTTLVQWLALTAARDGDRIPYVLPLRTLVRGPGLPAPGRFLEAVNCPHAAPEGWAERVLAAGRAVVLVDGIDEIPESDRGRTREWLRDLVAGYPAGNQWLVTTRPSAVRDDWLGDERFRELTLSPMREPEVRSFVHRWHRAAEAAGYEEPLLHALRTEPDLARLATNPLMCGLICALHRDRKGFLPLGRKSLYDAALTMLLSRRDRERAMGAPDGIELAEEPQIQLLQRLAYWLVRNGRSEMERARAEDVVARALPAVPSAAAQGDGPAVFRHLLLRSGLLLEPSPGAVVFVHRTFQEYLAARAAVEAWDVGVLLSHADDTAWEDVIRMAVAHARPRERAELLSLLTAHHSVRVRLLALSCLEHATELAPEVRAEVESRAAELIPPRDVEAARVLAEAGPLVLAYLPGPEGLTDDEARAVVVTASRIGTDLAIPVLARFREHASWQVRGQLAWVWHRFDTEFYGREVIAHLPYDDLYLVAHSPAELAALRGMGGRPWVQLEGDFEAEDLRAYLDPGQLTRLDVRGSLSDVEVLGDFPLLETLHFSGWRVGGPSLAPLAALPRLRVLRLAGPHTLLALLLDPASLGVLGQVTTLYLYELLSDDDLELLPRVFPALETLHVFVADGHEPHVDPGFVSRTFPAVTVHVSTQRSTDRKHD